MPVTQGLDVMWKMYSESDMEGNLDPKLLIILMGKKVCIQKPYNGYIFVENSENNNALVVHDSSTEKQI